MFAHFARKAAKPIFTQTTQTSKLAFSTTTRTTTTKNLNFFQPRSTTTRRPFSTTTTTPVPPAAETVQPTQQQPIPEEATPTWKNPVVFTLDALVAGAVAYGGVQVYNFLFDQPPIIDVMFDQAQQSPFLIENLGVPMKRDIIWWGTADDHQARVNFGISGPKGSGQLEGKAFRMSQDHWELIYLYGALPQFENRLTDLLPVEEDLVNTMPYIPDPSDPSAAHALAGAPAFPFTSANNNTNTSGEEVAAPVLLPNPAYNATYTPFQKGENHQDWIPEPVSKNGDDDEDGFIVKRHRNVAQEQQIAAEITRQHLQELEDSKPKVEEVVNEAAV